MNNRNWIAVFLGLACLVLFVSVMGASGNWLTNNNDTNNGATPQQINQTVRDMNTPPQDGNLPTEIDSNKVTDDVTNGVTDAANDMKNIITGNNNANENQANMSQMTQ